MSRFVFNPTIKPLLPISGILNSIILLLHIYSNTEKGKLEAITTGKEVFSAGMVIDMLVDIIDGGKRMNEILAAIDDLIIADDETIARFMNDRFDFYANFACLILTNNDILFRKRIINRICELDRNGGMHEKKIQQAMDGFIFEQQIT